MTEVEHEHPYYDPSGYDRERSFPSLQAALLGRSVSSVRLEWSDAGYEKGPTRLIFETLTGPVVLLAEGQCCSISWFESIDDPAALLGTIYAIRHLDLPHRDSPDPTNDDGESESRAYYGLKISTEKGSAVIDYRNDSNGYYGGYVIVESAP